MAAALLPCFRSAASIYLSPEVIWRYLMTTILFWPEKFRRQYRRSPRLSIVAAPVHLVFEFATPNISFKAGQFLRFSGHPELPLQESTPCRNQAPELPTAIPKTSRRQPSV